MNEAMVAAAVLAPVVVGLVEAAKRTAQVGDRYAPALAVACGVGLAFVVPPGADWRNEVLAGLMAGLAASGLWSGTKAAAGR